MALTSRLGIVDSVPSNVWLGGAGTSTLQDVITTPVRITQGLVEVLYQDDNPAARITQGFVEVLGLFDNATRVSQVVAELVRAETAELRASQVVAEILTTNTPVQTVMTQFVVEVLHITMLKKGYSHTWMGSSGGVWID